MTAETYIAIAGVIATLLGIVVTWLVMRKSVARKRLTYRLRVDRMLNGVNELGGDLRITYQEEELPDPAFVSLDVSNVGNVAAENVVITVEAPGPTYLIPAYFEDIPAGYDDLWTLRRTDAEQCEVTLQHINPGQTVRARFLMDENPAGEPEAWCAMPNIEFVKGANVELSSFGEIVLQVAAPNVWTILRSSRP